LRASGLLRLLRLQIKAVTLRKSIGVTAIYSLVVVSTVLLSILSFWIVSNLLLLRDRFVREAIFLLLLANVGR